MATDGIIILIFKIEMGINTLTLTRTHTHTHAHTRTHTHTHTQQQHSFLQPTKLFYFFKGCGEQKSLGTSYFIKSKFTICIIDFIPKLMFDDNNNRTTPTTATTGNPDLSLQMGREEGFWTIK